MSESKDPYGVFETFRDNYYRASPDRTLVTINSLLWNGDVALVPWLEDQVIDPEEITTDDAIDYFEDLTKVYNARSQHHKANMSCFVYGQMNQRGYISVDKNPFKIVYEDHDILDPIIDKEVRMYSVEQIREILLELHPIIFTASMIMIKTTRRIGGVCNIDLCDVHLAHPGANWEIIDELKDKPDHIYFAPYAEKGSEWRGEVRRDSQKSQKQTFIPIDDELKDCIIFLLSFRRASPTSGPLLTNVGSIKPGQRLSSSIYSARLCPVAKDLGYWIEPNHQNNIRAHYWRHWTTTHMKDRVNSSIVDYFRGDKKEISDDYNHWSKEKARKWLDNIPKIFERYQRY